MYYSAVKHRTNFFRNTNYHKFSVNYQKFFVKIAWVIRFFLLKTIYFTPFRIL